MKFSMSMKPGRPNKKIWIICCFVFCYFIYFFIVLIRSRSQFSSSHSRDECMCANPTSYSIAYFRPAFDYTPQIKEVKGLHASCCIVPKSCAQKANGVIADGTEKELAQWELRKAAGPNQIWAVMGFERPESGSRLYTTQEALDQFGAHYTMTSLVDSDFPLEIRSPSNIIDTYTPLCNNASMFHQKDIFYLASNCVTGSDRDSFVKILMKYLPIDSMGECLKNKEFPPQIRHLDIDPKTGKSVRLVWGDWPKALEALLCYYKFQVIIANAICDDYVDEKLVYAFQRGIIPIYLGMPNIDLYDPGLIRGVHRAIISVLDFDSFEDLAAHIKALLSDVKAYERYFEFRNEETPKSAYVARRETDRPDLGQYFGSGSMLKNAVHLSWFCDRVANGTRPRGKISGRCYGPWHQFLKSRNKHGFVAAFETPN